MKMLFCGLGQSLVSRGLAGLTGSVLLGEHLVPIAADVISHYRQAGREGLLAADLEQALQADPDLVRAEAVAAVAGRSEAERELVAAWLTQVPGVARQSLRRREDPRGRTVGPLDLRDPVVLSALLPRRLPRFRADQPVPHAPQWRLVALLGSGGFGEVWLARHSFLGQQRAYKFCLDAAARERLLRHEAEVVRRVMAESQGMRPDAHGIVPLVDAYLEGETPWLAYDYVAGGDLSALVRNLAQQPAAARGSRALEVLRTLAAIVGRFHRLAQPIIHRDLKPSNILLHQTDRGWLLRVTDFGISQVAAERSVGGGTVLTPGVSLGETMRGAHTPLYASPQQKRGQRADVRDDVYALGVIGYQLLVGDVTAERPAGKWRRRLAECAVDEATLDLLESCWDDDPAERPRDAQALAEGLGAGRRAAPPEVQQEKPRAEAPAEELGAVKRAAPLEVVREKQVVDVSVPGWWYRRPARDWATGWVAVCKTPAGVVVEPDACYQLCVDRSAVDADLAGLAHLRGLTALQHLSLRACKQVSDGAKDALRKALPGCRIL